MGNGNSHFRRRPPVQSAVDRRGRSVYVEFEEVLGGFIVVAGFILVIVKRFIVVQLFDGHHRQTALHSLRQLRRVRTRDNVSGQVEQVNEHLVPVAATHRRFYD